MASADESFEGWNWEDPDALNARFETFTADLGRCEKLELVPRPVPVSRQDFQDIGLAGIEFAAFTTRHPAALGTDLVALSAPGLTTEPGKLYRANGASYFTQLDISKKLPFDDGAVDWAYAEHLIEHVPLLVAIDWLAEVRRVLAPGGLLRVTTPDLRKYARGYAEGDAFFARHRRRQRNLRFGPPMPERNAFMFNQIFFLYGHRWLYDLEELQYALSQAGFTAPVRECEYGEGARPDVARLDTIIRRVESIYIEVTA